MEFHEKLQVLRKQKGWTQEELAQKLYVSRTAISKWESGRGYPNIDSLKAIAVCFSVSIDELLSSNEVLTIAEEDNRQKRVGLQNWVFGLLDFSGVFFLFLRFFSETVDGAVYAVSLLSLSVTAPYMQVAYLMLVMGITLFGALTLLLRNYSGAFWIKHRYHVSLLLSVIGVVMFIISPQPYVAMVLFVFLLIKMAILVKKE